LKYKQAHQFKPETYEIMMFESVKMQKANCAVCGTVTFKALPRQVPADKLKSHAWTKAKHKKQGGER